MADCLFCKIVKKEIEARILFEEEDVLSFYDINPQAPVHILVIPKKHIEKLSDIKEEDEKLLFNLINACNRVAKITGISEKGYRVVVNIGRESGQSVFHIHFHVLGGRPMRWPPG